MTKNWDQEKDRMYELYMVRGMKLVTLQKIMKEQYGFNASERAYKQKFKEWRWFKKTPRTASIPQNNHDLEGTGSDVDLRDDGSDTSSNIYVASPPSSFQGHMGHHYDPSGAYYHPTSPHAQYSRETSCGIPRSDSMNLVSPITYTYSSPMPPVMTPSPRTEHVSLPPFTTHFQRPFEDAAHKERFRDSIREAEHRVEYGQLDHAHLALENALSILREMRESSSR